MEGVRPITNGTREQKHSGQVGREDSGDKAEYGLMHH